ncbi:MAG: type IV toxin-antitoxin system AbiEi family antitoxin [Rhodocyclaceae bacterium]
MNAHHVSSQPFLDTIRSVAEANFADVALTVSLQPSPTAEGDGFATVSAAGEGLSSSMDYVIEVKRIHSATQLSSFAHRAQLSHRPRLLLTDYMTGAMGQAARSMGIQYLDAAGNAYLRLPQHLIISEGKRRPDHRILTTSSHDAPLITTGRLTGASGAAATKILYAILAQPARFPTLTQREIAAMATVAPGSVSHVLTRYEELGWLRQTTRNRASIARAGALLEPDRLLEEFSLNYVKRLREKEFLQRLRPTDDRWNGDLDLSAFSALWGGEVAADRLVGDYRAAQYSVFAPAATLSKLMSAFRLVPDPKGPITVTQPFWNIDQNAWGGPPPYSHAGHVPPPLIYAELMALADARALELAQRVRQHWLNTDF